MADDPHMSDSLSLDDSFSHDGLWWLPANPDDRLTGTLTFDQAEGARLQVLGLFGGLSAFDQGDGEAKTIHGLTKNGREVTLLGCISVNRQFNAPGIMSEKYHAHYALIGHHFVDGQEEIFDKCYFRFARLEEWLNASPFNESWTFDPVKLSLCVDKGVSEHISDVLDFKLGKSSNFSKNSDSTDYHVKVISMLHCEASGPKTVSWHITTASRLQELGSLCAGHYLPLTHMKVVLDKSFGLSKSGRLKDVDIFMQVQHPQSKSKPNHVIPLFSLNELVSANNEALSNWLRQYGTLSPAIDLFFAITGDKSMFLSVRFLLAIQALEVFHRRTATGLIMSKVDYKLLRKRLVEQIPSDTPQEMKDKLVGSYAFANEWSLMQRLSAVISEIENDLGESVEGFKEPFARSVVDTRNYNTHFSSNLERKALDGADMYWATQRMILLLTCLFLKKIGVSPRAFRGALGRHNEFEMLFDRAGLPF